MSKYDPKYCQMLIDHGAKGLSFETFAAEIGVSRRALYDWEKKYDDFAEAKEQAFNKRNLLIEKLLIGASSGKIRVNSHCLIFSAKNILGWKDTIHNENNVEEDIKITLNYNLDEEDVKEEPKEP